MPQLSVLNTAGTVVGSATATSVAPGGVSATFPFPTSTSGGSLGSGFYFFLVKNLTSAGESKFIDGTYFDLGGDTTLSSALGVDAGIYLRTEYHCVIGPGGKEKCSEASAKTSEPVVTQYYSGQVTYLGETLAVGSYPVAVKLYGSYTYTSPPDGDLTVTETYPPNAVVANSGSNSVSFVNFVNKTSTSVAVGTQPMAVALNSADTYAYVPNYGSGTLSEVDLSTQAVSRTATVGTGVQSVAMDPSGSYVWVGGANYLYKIALSTFTVAASYPVSGSVTSMAASNAQNELVYTLVQNCCSGSSTYVANEVSLSNMSTLGSHAQGAASAYAPYTMNGTLPSAAVIPTATAVSAQFGNGMAASATPTGFVIYDVVSHHQIMTGTTPTPVRGIASDPLNLFAYFTVPDSNEYITVPLPQP